MGTHTYLFATTTDLPTLRELLDWAASKGHPLKLSLEMFDDDEEEAAFLAENMDSAEWRNVDFADPEDRWVGDLSYMRVGDAFFAESIGEFKARVAQLPESPGKTRVVQQLETTQLLVDFQHNVSEQETWPAQDNITEYFSRRADVIGLLENVGQFVRQGKVILKIQGAV